MWVLWDLGLEEVMYVCPHDRTNVLRRRGRDQSFLCPSYEDTYRKQPSVRGRGPQLGTKLAGTLIINFSTPRNIRNIFLLLKSTFLWYPGRAAWYDQTRRTSGYNKFRENTSLTVIEKQQAKFVS